MICVYCTDHRLSATFVRETAVRISTLRPLSWVCAPPTSGMSAGAERFARPNGAAALAATRKIRQQAGPALRIYRVVIVTSPATHELRC